MNTAQIAVNFTPNMNTLNARIPIVRKGAISRYDEAIQYLREELKNGGWSSIRTDEFASTFKITSSFLHLCVEIGAVEAGSKKKGQGRFYKALPKLSTLTGLELRNFRLDEFPNPDYVVPQHLLNKTPEQRQEFINAMNKTTSYLSVGEVIAQTMITSDEKPPVTWPEPVYLVGMVAQDLTLEAGTVPDQRFNNLDDARDCVRNWSVQVGTKLVIVQVIEVVESAVLLQASTL